jgi:hypothetical protein
MLTAEEIPLLVLPLMNHISEIDMPKIISQTNLSNAVIEEEINTTL